MAIKPTVEQAAPRERSSSWLRSSIERLEKIAAADTIGGISQSILADDPPTGPGAGNVRAMMTADQREKKIREYSNRLVSLDVDIDKKLQEREETRAKLIRIQEQHDAAFKDHMTGWAVSTELLNPLKSVKRPLITVEPRTEVTPDEPR